MRRKSHAASGLLTAVAAATCLFTATTPAQAADSGPVGGGRLGESGVVLFDGSKGAAAPPDVPVESYVVADATTGQVIAAKNAHERLRPASTLKTLTAVTLMPVLDKKKVYTAVYDDAAAEGSKAGIVPGATYTVDDLFNGLFLPSGNDCAHALANAAGGVEAAVTAINAEAKHLQAKDTTVVNPSGLDADGQLSSAYDLALIARAGLQLDDFRAYASKISADFPAGPVPDGQPRPTFKIYTQNKLLLRQYPGAIGVKTGYTTLAGRTYVGAAERDGHTLIVTLMKIGAPTENVAEMLLNWGFTNAATAGSVGRLVEPAQGSTDSPSPVVAAANVLSTPTDKHTARSDHGWSTVVGVGLVGSGILLAAAGVSRRRPRRRRPDLPPA